jgi:hypothetical protein
MSDKLLYVCNDYYVLLFENDEHMERLTKGLYISTWAHGTITAGYWSMFWSKELNQKVTYIPPKEPFYVVKKSNDEKNWLVIVDEKIGWIIVEKWLNIK